MRRRCSVQSDIHRFQLQDWTSPLNENNSIFLLTILTSWILNESILNAYSTRQPRRRRTIIYSLQGGKQVPFYATDEVIDRTQRWFKSGLLRPSKALRYADTVDERWFVSKATISEEAYADIWAMVFELRQIGGEYRGGVVSSVMVAPTFSTFNAPQWRNSP
jgi:hypothetical protein